MEKVKNEVFDKIDKIFAKYENVEGFQTIAGIDNPDFVKCTDEWKFYNNTFLAYSKSMTSESDLKKFNAEIEPEFKKFEFYREEEEEGMPLKRYILKRDADTVIAVLQYTHDEEDYVYTVDSCEVPLKNLDLYLSSSHTSDD